MKFIASQSYIGNRRVTCLIYPPPKPHSSYSLWQISFEIQRFNSNLPGHSSLAHLRATFLHQLLPAHA